MNVPFVPVILQSASIKQEVFPLARTTSIPVVNKRAYTLQRPGIDPPGLVRYCAVNIRNKRF